MSGSQLDCPWAQYPYPTKPLDLANKFGYIGSKLNADELLSMDEERAKIGRLVFDLIENKAKDIGTVYSAHIKILALMRAYFPKWHVFCITIDNDRQTYRSVGLFDFEWYSPSIGTAYSSKIVRFETVLLATLYANLNFNVGTMAAELGKPYKEYYYASYRLYAHVVAVQIRCWPLRDERTLPFEATTQGGELGKLLCLIILQAKAIDVAKDRLQEARTGNAAVGVSSKWIALTIRLAIWLYVACIAFEEIYIARAKDYKALHRSYDCIGSKLKLYAAYLTFALSAMEMESQSKHANCMVFANAILRQKGIEASKKKSGRSIGLFGFIGAKDSGRSPPISIQNGDASADCKAFSVAMIHEDAERMKRTNDSVWYASEKNSDSNSPWALVPVRDGAFFRPDDMGDLDHLGFTASELTAVSKMLRK